MALSGEENAGFITSQGIDFERESAFLWLRHDKNVPFHYIISANALYLGYGDFLVCIYHFPTKQTSKDELIRRVRESVPYETSSKILVSGLLQKETGIPDILDQLMTGYPMICHNKRQEDILLAADYEAEVMIAYQMLNQPAMCRRLVKKYIQPLIEYDSTHNNCLLDTLAIYFQCRSIAEIAKKCFVHENTIRYRLKLVDEIAGLDSRDIRDQLKLYLALQYHVFQGQ